MLKNKIRKINGQSLIYKANRTRKTAQKVSSHYFSNTATFQTNVITYVYSQDRLWSMKIVMNDQKKIHYVYEGKGKSTQNS